MCKKEEDEYEEEEREREKKTSDLLIKNRSDILPKFEYTLGGGYMSK